MWSMRRSFFSVKYKMYFDYIIYVKNDMTNIILPIHNDILGK